jgi:hypothetical protein
MKRERRTVEAMVLMHCRARHGTATGLCTECRRLLDYASKRLKRCPFQENKPTCGHCTVHCYQPEMRERIRTVMKFAGPRMLYRHPVLAFRHLLDSRRKAPSCRSRDPDA